MPAQLPPTLTDATQGCIRCRRRHRTGVFAVGSMATAELQQNDVRHRIEEGGEFSCNVVTVATCSGVAERGREWRRPSPDVTVDDDRRGRRPRTDGQSHRRSPSRRPWRKHLRPGPRAAARTRLSTKIALGDSVMLGAAGRFTELGFTVDAAESRAWVRGIDIVETLQREPPSGDVLVIHLGTNGPIGQAGMDRMMAALATVPRVLLVTNDVARDYTEENNRLIYGAAEAYPNVEIARLERVRCHVSR